MNWMAEFWKWGASNFFLWFVMLWWFTIPVFLLSSYARWWVERRDWSEPLSQTSKLPVWVRILALGATASWWGDWKRLAMPFAIGGGEMRFTLAVVASHVLPIYVLLIIFALGKEYLLVYLIAAGVFVPLVLLGAKVFLSFSERASNTLHGEAQEHIPFWMAPIKEFVGVAPRFLYGVVAAAVIAAIAIQPKFAFPVEITGGGLAAQLLNALLGIVAAVGLWVPPVGVVLLSVPIWRGGIALAGLIAFFFAILAAPQAIMAYSEWIGRRQAAKFAAIVLLVAVVTGMLVTLIVRGLGRDLPYQYSPDQLLR